MWIFGNTSVRSPLRLRAGLIALKNSGLEGQIRGSKEADINFRNLMCSIYSVSNNNLQIIPNYVFFTCPYPS